MDKKQRDLALKEILALHEKWSDSLGMEGERLSFSYANLRGADFNGADLHGASFYGANLEDASLRHANLRRAHMDDTNLELADLKGAKVYWHDLIKINLMDSEPKLPCAATPPTASPRRQVGSATPKL